MPTYMIASKPARTDSAIVDGPKTVYVPINREILESISVGDEVVVTMRAKVASLSDHQGEYSSTEASFEPTEISVYSADESDQDAFEIGFAEGYEERY